MIPKISVCCFIRDNNEGAFCLWESMASLITIADEYIVMDFGSTDGTLEILNGISKKNQKIKIVRRVIGADESGPEIFATMANELIAMSKNELVLYHQADEVFHECLVDRIVSELEILSNRIPDGWKGMNFWRVQLRNNFQRVGWWSHPVNRLDLRTRMHHVGDGMNTDRPWDPPFIGDYDGGATWESSYKHDPASLPMHHMILDVGRKGGFLENIYQKSLLHAPHWGEQPMVEGILADDWVARERKNPEWTMTASPFNLPAIMRPLVGELRYKVRPEVLNMIAEG